jgi:hypothetical protein
MNSRNAYGNDCCVVGCTPTQYMVSYSTLYMLYFSILYMLLYSITGLASLVEYNLVPHSDVKWDSINYIITLNILPHAGIQGGNVELQ